MDLGKRLGEVLPERHPGRGKRWSSLDGQNERPPGALPSHQGLCPLALIRPRDKPCKQDANLQREVTDHGVSSRAIPARAGGCSGQSPASFSLPTIGAASQSRILDRHRNRLSRYNGLRVHRKAVRGFVRPPRWPAGLRGRRLALPDSQHRVEHRLHQAQIVRHGCFPHGQQLTMPQGRGLVRRSGPGLPGDLISWDS
jgi:hypothetical protein